ncbi:dienelactone hydrolase family protein [Pseudohalocynthiibacter aestuariivivens]|uniref:Dienelactone hydrolase family protein n=1 Tax=Pseudohalocynthiibacter aestuariivivens TaxID=1591409 RepID=A0ABV5JCN4_9RHOB|nr:MULTISPECIES: alpha/beta family hydrolase [Pseudohalocynthiibacter]MBS9717302.1 dienelactone hydrolase family protein [Pseudohalocynthiibacter aestuariivivens]MCK0104229.1 dienelactone hydrolase family protein [Pseudohalocynthiibacter sp. F2068]
MNNVKIEKRNVILGSKSQEGILRLPDDALGLVVFAHGAGSSRLSPRNNYVADRLAERNIATLLFDLLTEAEAADREKVFDIPLLSGRLLEAIEWVRDQPELSQLKMGLFGASTGAAAALVAASWQKELIVTVVSRGGRPDLAGAELSKVTAPTFLIVGGADYQVIKLNEDAAHQFTCDHKMTLVPHATHLFEEPGTLDSVVDLAADWFVRSFAKSTAE